VTGATFFQPLQIALTGATGFVGAHTVQELAGRGHDLRLLVRDAARLPADIARWATVVEGGLDDEPALQRLVQGADVVIHVAGAIKAQSPGAFLAVNEAGTARLASAAAAAQVKRFVHVSSLAAREPHLSGYCASKAAGEVAVRKVAVAAHGMELVIIRPPAVYGPGDRATLPLIRELSGKVAIMTGTDAQRLSLIHVADLASALAAAAEGAGRDGACYEIDDGTPGGYSHAAMAEAAAHTTGRTPAVVHLPRWLMALVGLASEGWMRAGGRAVILSRGKTRELWFENWVCSGEKFEDAGPWRARYRFAEGFGQTLTWYRDNGWLPAS
jgi:nucleoside-diphosphate-sugar epimerase